VLDFSQVYAGPTCTRLLADLGAEVWKAEGFARLDTARGGYTAENDPSGVYWNRGFYHLPRNLGKKSLAIDLTRPEALGLVSC
jgi:crotonobetainyl-CoA:carnitine CoA-transferase CaiB-like acyl-CoA transferase